MQQADVRPFNDLANEPSSGVSDFYECWGEQHDMASTLRK
jgi:hypothetical protein